LKRHGINKKGHNSTVLSLTKENKPETVSIEKPMIFLKVPLPVISIRSIISPVNSSISNSELILGYKADKIKTGVNNAIIIGLRINPPREY